MSARRLAFARARWPVVVAMRVVAAWLAADGAGTGTGARRSVLSAPCQGRRVVAPEAPAARAAPLPRGHEDLH